MAATMQAPQMAKVRALEWSQQQHTSAELKIYQGNPKPSFLGIMTHILRA